MKTIAIIFGGVSSEYEISLQSAYSVLTHLDSSELNIVALGITREGSWFHYTGDLRNIERDTWHTDTEHCHWAMLVPDRSIHGFLQQDERGWQVCRLDMAMPVLHGKNGEDGTIQGLIEMAGIPLIGCGVLSSALCMDKYRAHQIVSHYGIEVARSFVMNKGMSQANIEKKLSRLCWPLFVKPLKAGSSFGISRIESRHQFDSAIEMALLHDDEVIVEESIEGFEVGCAVMGNKESLTLGEVDEIELTEGFFDFKEKYTLGTSKIHIPARLAQEERDRIKKAAGIIYNALGCKSFARVDMFYTPDHRIVFNEVNTIPGFTSHSRYPNMMKGIGVSFEELLKQLIEEAVE